MRFESIKTQFKTIESGFVECKIVIDYSTQVNQFFLSQRDETKEDGDEDDYLTMDKLPNGEMFINGNPINKRVADEIIRFLTS